VGKKPVMGFQPKLHMCLGVALKLWILTGGGAVRGARCLRI